MQLSQIGIASRSMFRRRKSVPPSPSASPASLAMRRAKISPYLPPVEPRRRRVDPPPQPHPRRERLIVELIAVRQAGLPVEGDENVEQPKMNDWLALGGNCFVAHYRPDHDRYSVEWSVMIWGQRRYASRLQRVY